MRESYARLRRIVSDAVLSGAGYHEALTLATKAESSLIASARGLAMAGQFRKWIAGMTMADILYQDAYDAVKARQKGNGARLSIDQIAALEIAPRSK